MLYIFSYYKMQTTNGNAKEIADYYECLKEAKNRYRFKYILVLEDDAEPATSTAIEEITYSVIPLVMEQKPDVIFSKLIYSNGYHGFVMDFEAIIDITTFSLLISFIVYCLLLVMDKLQHSRRILITIIVTFVALLFVIALGRQSTLLALKTFLVPYRTSKAHKSQTTAILYPRTKLNEVLFLVETKFTCKEENYKQTIQGNSKEEIAIDLQLANVVEKEYNGKNVMIWTSGHFFNHIGFFTSLHFKRVHKDIAHFATSYTKLPDQICNEPM